MKLSILVLMGLMCIGLGGCVDADDDGGGTDTVVVEGNDVPDNNTTIIEDNDPPADADVNVDVDAGGSTTP
jgi:hypothetical protein